jgi:DNA-directed RNA polymerase subunit F
MQMTQTEDEEKMLTHAEVKAILEASLDKPNVIYTGPEEDNVKPTEMTTEEEGEEEVDKFKELSFEKRATVDHVGNFKRIDEKHAKSMIKDLLKLERVTEYHAYKISEILPRDEMELRPVFAKDRFSLTPEELKSILEIVDKHRI